MGEKAKTSQDFIYGELVKHNVNMSRLTELMGVSSGLLTGCFRHDLNRLGKPMKLSRGNVEKLNIALDELAKQIKQCIIVFGSEQKFTNQRGNTYDPATLPAVKALSRYFKLNSFCERVLGWNLAKKEMILCSPSSKVYGNISADDVNRINAEILSVSGVLAGYEVVADEDK